MSLPPQTSSVNSSLAVSAEMRAEWRATPEQKRPQALELFKRQILACFPPGSAWHADLDDFYIQDTIRDWLESQSSLEEHFELFISQASEDQPEPEPARPVRPPPDTPPAEPDPVDLAGVTSQWNKPVSDREWYVQGWLPAGRLTLLSGPGGAGKSRLALQLAASMACGRIRWLGLSGPLLTTKDPVPVLMAAYEDEVEEIQRRLNIMAWETSTGVIYPAARLVTATDNLALTIPNGPLWSPQPNVYNPDMPGALTPHGQEVRRIAEERGAKLLVLDPLAAVYAGNENNRSQVRPFNDSWNRWAAKTGCAVLVVSHPNKAENEDPIAGQGYSGSSDWRNGARAAWVLGRPRKENEPQGMVLVCKKSSYGPMPDPIWLKGFPDWVATTEEDALDDAQRLTNTV